MLPLLRFLTYFFPFYVVTISANLSADIPTTETVLFQNGGNLIQGFTVPAGVNVLKLNYIVMGTSIGNFSVQNNNNKKYWVNDTYEIDTGDTVYIGVTSGKYYSLWFLLTVDDGDGYAEYTVSYSQSINQQATNVNDY